MVFAVVAIGILIGVVEGLYLHVMLLLLTAFFVMVGTAAAMLAHGHQISFVAVTTVLLGTSLQIGYLFGSLARGAVAQLSSRRWAVYTDYTYRSARRLGNLKRWSVRNHMEVVGSDGRHVGTVDHKEGADRIILTKDDPKAGGQPHLIWTDWIAYVDKKVHLNRPSRKAMSEWHVAA
jgi:hypothetical protein